VSLALELADKHRSCKFAICTGAVVDGDDLSNYDMAGDEQEQRENDTNTLDQLQRELTSDSLGVLFIFQFTAVKLSLCFRVRE